MSTDAEITQVYRQEIRRPSYVIQEGRHIQHISRTEKRREWIWGHFAQALEKALKNAKVVRL